MRFIQYWQKKLEKPREKHGKFQLLTVFRKIDKRELFYDTVLIYKSILTKKSEELSRFFPYQFENGEKLSKTKEIAPHWWFSEKLKSKIYFFDKFLIKLVMSNKHFLEIVEILSLSVEKMGHPRKPNEISHLWRFSEKSRNLDYLFHKFLIN